MKISVKTILLKSSQESAAQAGEILRSGGLVAIPTETVYGLAANALNSEAVKNIFRAKGRPGDNPLIVHIAEFEDIYPLVTHVPESAKALAEAFWSGPLTIVLPKSDLVPETVSGGLDTVAIRMPSHPDARAIIKSAGVPLAAPSANTSGKPSPTDAESVLADLEGKIEAVYDGGKCSVGVESTVISLAGEKPILLRPGGITYEQLCSVLGEVQISGGVLNPLAEGETARSPGMKYKHYAPEAKITILKGDIEKFAKYVTEHSDGKTAVMCFEGEENFFSVPCVTYGSEEDSASQAQRLFEALRLIDETGAKRAYARYPEPAGVGLAVLNRLLRAAAFEVTELE